MRVGHLCLFLKESFVDLGEINRDIYGTDIYECLLIGADPNKYRSGQFKCVFLTGLIIMDPHFHVYEVRVFSSFERRQLHKELNDVDECYIDLYHENFFVYKTMYNLKYKHLASL